MNSAEVLDRPAVAVIGLAGRFPGARNVDEFWWNLCNGVESISFFGADELRSTGVPESWVSDPRYVRANGVLADVEMFDADFFGFTPREAEITDPQHRIFLECAWEAIENAGYDPQIFAGRIGVYAGAGMSTYLLRNVISAGGLPKGVSEFQALMGNNKDYVPTRVSYKLNLKGPSISVGTACSTSLVAIHLACQALLDYQCDIALAGGVGIQVPQSQGYWYESGGIGSPDGHCRAFDSRGQGTVSGNGAGIVVLRRLADALEARDCIRAVIRGSAVNNDGHVKAGYTAPGVEGQAEVISEALAVSEVEPDTITYVEAHGTGTALGDPIEVAALTQAFRYRTQKNAFCAIGSVKTNIGHLDEAAGVAGLIKTVLCLENRRIPATLNFEQPNAEIRFEDSPFFVSTSLTEWNSEYPRRAGVSSFGIGGTNAHAVLEEAPPRFDGQPVRRWHILPVSARSNASSSVAASNLAAHLREQAAKNTGASAAYIANAAYTLSVGRRAFDHRVAVVSDGPAGASAALESALQSGISRAREGRAVVFMFPGQGAQYAGMARDLYATEQLFRATVDETAHLLRPSLGFDFRDVLYPSGSSDAADPRLKQTVVAQPVLFSLEYALARVWMHWGIQPQAMIGHSLGEYVAACIAGVFSLEDGLALVAARGALMQKLDGGAMLAVPLSESQLRDRTGNSVSVAAVNGPSLTVVAGPARAVHTLRDGLAADGIESTLLATSHAFHSDMMEPITGPLLQQFSRVRLRPPAIPYLSNLTGDWISPAMATDPMYWVGHTRQTVRFGDALQKLFTADEPVLLEVGPGRNLATAAVRHPAKSKTQPVCTSVRHPHEHEPDDRFLLATAAKMWAEGVTIDWNAFYAGERRSRVPLPTYPFERQRYWLESNRALNTATQVHDGAPEKISEISRWFYVPSWKRTTGSQRAETAGAIGSEQWLIFGAEADLGLHLAKRLRTTGREVATVRSGAQFQRTGADYLVNADDLRDYVSLIRDFFRPGCVPYRIIHVSAATDSDHVSETDIRPFQSLVAMAQALQSVYPGAEAEIIVVSSCVHDVLGTEDFHPASATLLGPVKVLPQECPAITCRNVDFVLPDNSNSSLERLLDQLEAELYSTRPEAIVAFRGAYRWSQAYEPVNIDSPSISRLRHGGVYLITGGLGGIGTILANYLARTFEAKLILVGRTGLPSRSEWPRYFASVTRDSGPQFILADHEKTVQRLAADVAHETGARLLDEYEGFTKQANALCTSYIFEYLQLACVPDLKRGGMYSVDVLRQHARIQSRFDKFLDFFLRVLADDLVIRRFPNGTFELLREPSQIPSSSILRADILRRYPEFTGLIELLDSCAQQYAPALSGDIEPISVLYPDGSPVLLERAAQQNSYRSQREVFTTVLAKLISRAIQDTPGKTFRILEVGIGEGILTRAVAPDLPAGRVEYWATDIGRSFVLRAEKEAVNAGLRFMKFGVFDISKEPATQGFEPSTFDFVLALDVVHATPSLSETLANIGNLLAPGGVLALIETVGASRWLDMIWGLADGWWLFSDIEVRQHSPLLTLGEWENVLTDAGFETVQVHPGSEAERRRADYGLLLAQKTVGSNVTSSDDPVTAQRIRNVQHLEELGSEVLVLQADVASEADMRAAVQAACQRFGALNGVIHAAGVTTGDQVFRPVSESASAISEALLRPKVRGAVTLAKVLSGHDLDFALLISSNAAILGGLGFSAYSAANCFLDSFAVKQAAKTAQRWISANWDGWPTEEHSAGTLRFQTSIDKFAMTRDECEQAFERVLSHAGPHVIVSAGDLSARLQYWTSRTALESPIAVARAAAAGSRKQHPGSALSTASPNFHARPDLPTPFSGPVTETEQTLCRMWQDLFGIDAIGTHDNFFDLRGDSLLAAQLIAAAGREFSIPVPIRIIFEQPTVSGTANYIDTTRASATMLRATVSEDEEVGSI